MADGDGATASVRSPSHRHRDSSDGVDSISALPDAILQTILLSLPTKFAIRTSILSKRWRNVWCDTPCLNFDWCGSRLSADSINETLIRYQARKMMSFHLCLTVGTDISYIESWIDFAKSRNVENMTLDLGSRKSVNYTTPDSFYINSSVKQLTLCLAFHDKINPRSPVSWPSLKKLVLRVCNFTDAGSAIPKILSGCPFLETLSLDMCRCRNLKVFDLTKSPRLRTLEIITDCWPSGQIHIVAPHIHCLSLIIPPFWPCNLVDVSSLIEARLEIGYTSDVAFDADFLEPIVQNILEKLHNVEKLTFGENFLKILSLAKIRHVLLPLFKCKVLTFETMISQYVILGIVKLLLQSSPELEKLTVHIKDGRIYPDEFFDCYLKRHGLRSKKYGSLEETVFKDIIRNNVETKHIFLFMELLIISTKTLGKMVVKLGSYLEETRIEELLEMVPLLSHNNNNVSIVLSSTTKSDQRFKCYNFILKR